MSDRFFGLLPGAAVQAELDGPAMAPAACGEPIMVRPLGLPRQGPGAWPARRMFRW